VAEIILLNLALHMAEVILLFLIWQNTRH